MQKLHRSVRTEILRWVRRITRREISEEQSRVYTLFTPETHGGPASSVQALTHTDTEMEMLETEEAILLQNEVEVTMHFINDENMTNCPHIDIKIGNGNAIRVRR